MMGQSQRVNKNISDGMCKQMRP